MATLKVPSPYSTIQAAVDAAESGDTIIVNNPLSGDSYNEQVDIINRHNIRIRANGNFLLDGSTPTSYAYAFLVHADNVTIEGITIKNYDRGIVLEGSNNTITKCILESNSSRAILIDDNDSNNVTRNRILNSNVSIYINNSCSNRIINNIILTSGITDSTGVRIIESNGNTIERNTITNEDGLGIYLQDSYSNSISRNNINDMFFGIIQYESSANNITKNTIHRIIP